MKNLFVALKLLRDRFHSLRREMAWILTGQFFGFVGGFIGIKILTNMLGPTGYGQLALGLTIAGLLNTYAYGPVANVVARYFSVYRERGRLNIYFTVLKCSHRRLALAGVTLAVVAGSGTAWFLGGEWALIVLLSFLYGIASGINASYISLQNAIRQRQVVALHQGADVWLRIGLSVALIFLFAKSGCSALLGYLLGTTLVTLSQRIFALRNSMIHDAWHVPATPPEKVREAWHEFSHYATSFMLFAVFASFSLYADRWLLQGLYGSGAVGIYAAVYQIAASPVNIFFSMVSQLVTPIVFERAGALTSSSNAKSGMALLRQTVMVSSLVALLITAVAAVCSGPLVRVLTNATFAYHHRLLPVMVIGLCIFNLGQQLTIKGLAFNQPRIYLLPKILQAASLLVSGYVLARWYAIAGVAWAVCLSSFVYLAAVLLVNGRLRLNLSGNESTGGTLA